MNARRGDSPERLLESEGTAFERRVLEQALARGPSKELSQRMAKALGVGVTTLAAPPSVAAPAPVAPAAASTSSLTWVWVSAVVVTLSGIGVVAGLRASKAARSAPTGPRLEAPLMASPVVPAESVPAPPPPSRAAGLPLKPSVPARPTADLHTEIELVDGARAAVVQNSPGRALELLARYAARYPAGSFVPEATAVKVEALMQLGRTEEARALAVRFLTTHRGTLLGDRVAAVAGLSRR
jgi:hypothetical protein